MLDELERDTVRIAASELENPQSGQVFRPEPCVGEIVGEVSFNALNETLGRMTLNFGGTNRRARQAVLDIEGDQRSHITERQLRLQPVTQPFFDWARGHLLLLCEIHRFALGTKVIGNN